MPQTYHLDLEPLTVDTATGEAGELLAAAEAKLGFVPNMYRHMARNPGLLATYMAGYERFRADPAFDPTEQEVVLLTISRVQGCRYCVAAHSFIADQMSGVPIDVTDAIRDGRPVPDPRLAALNRFTWTMVESRGRPGSAEVEQFRHAGFTDDHILSIILAMGVKTLSNFSNHVCQPDLDEVFAQRAWNG